MNKETANLLEQHFDTAFAAPDGVAKLRELILTLAMQGGLVEQDTNDPPAGELLKELKAEKQKLIKEKNIKKSNPLPTINSEEIPYALPQGWEWVRLGELIELISGQHLTPDKYNENGIGHPYYTGPADFGAMHPHASRWTNIDRAMAIKDDILLTVKGAGVGKTNILSDETAAISRQLMALRVTRINRDYILRFLDTIFYELQALAVGIAIPGISRNDVLLRKVPLPPLPEQHRIVARIDQLMSRCDELEKLHKEREEQRLAVHAAAVRGLLNASDGSAWDFIEQHFSELYTVKENVAELRKTILQLSVMGRLVPQDPNDPPADELLKEIKAEKQRLIKEKKIKKPKPLPPIKPEEAAYERPIGWEWVRFGDMTTEIATGPFGSMIHKSDYVSDGIPLINPSHMVDGKIIHDSSVSVSHRMAKKLSSYRLFENDIVMARRGEMGRCAIVTTESNRFLCGTGSFVLRFIDNIDRQYILYLFKTEYVREYLGGNSVGTTMTNLNHGILNSMPILLPSFPEQHRIVTRIDQLMALCDTLEQKIEATTGKQTELLNAVMAQV
nr:restriction endonuclease subunit S [uncultured Desulfobacter sp.]